MFDFLKPAPQATPADPISADSISADPISADPTPADPTPADPISADPISEIPDLTLVPSESSSPAVTALSAREQPEDAVLRETTVEEYLALHGFRVDFSQSEAYDETCGPVKELAVYMAEHHDLLSDFLGHLRRRIGKDLTVFFSLTPLNDEAKKETIRFVKEKLSPFGLLSNALINGAGIVTARIPNAKKVIAFLNGGWLEMYARKVVEEEISLYADEKGLSYQVFSNLKISGENSLHELDVVCKLGHGRLCVVEAKSGNFRDYCELLDRGYDIATIPNHTLLLNATTTDEAALGFSHFYGIYCSNLKDTSFRASLRKMLEQSVRI